CLDGALGGLSASGSPGVAPFTSSGRAHVPQSFLLLRLATAGRGPRAGCAPGDPTARAGPPRLLRRTPPRPSAIVRAVPQAAPHTRAYNSSSERGAAISQQVERAAPGASGRARRGSRRQPGRSHGSPLAPEPGATSRAPLSTGSGALEATRGAVGAAAT